MHQMEIRVSKRPIYIGFNGYLNYKKQQKQHWLNRSTTILYCIDYTRAHAHTNTHSWRTHNPAQSKLLITNKSVQRQQERKISILALDVCLFSHYSLSSIYLLKVCQRARACVHFFWLNERIVCVYSVQWWWWRRKCMQINKWKIKITKSFMNQWAALSMNSQQ